MSLKGNLTDNWNFFRESWESCKIATELDKKLKPVILETLKIVLGRETYQIAKKICLQLIAQILIVSCRL